MMTRLSGNLAHTMLRIAALAVPGSLRRPWLAEWHGELFQILRDHDSEGPFRDSPVGFALGAFQDAIWMRGHCLDAKLCVSPALLNSRRCLGVLGIISAATILASLAIPALRRQILPAPFQGPRNLAILSLNASLIDSDLEVYGGTYQSWRGSNNPDIIGTVYYQPTVAVLQAGTQTNELMMAWANDVSPLFATELIASAIHMARRSNAVPLILSHDLWESQFAGDLHAVGRSVQIAGKPAIIVGVAPQWAADLPGSIAAWAIESPEAMSVIENRRFAYGYVLARTPIAFDLRHRRSSLIMHGTDRGTNLEVVPLTALASEHRRGPLLTFLRALGVAALLMPVILVIWPIKSTPFRSFRITNVKFLALLSTKLALVMPLVYCIPLGIATLFACGSPDTVICLQAVATYAAGPIAVYWCLHDQSQRCPNCLRLLTNPAHVGESSRSFLAWSGTELICKDGHGLLHVPDYPTSWYPGGRWLSLDMSWQHLFQS